jgi:2Fe-2S ferredoxin
MQAAVHHGIAEIAAECGGNAMCATFYVYVDGGCINRLTKMTEDEDALLDGVAAERLPNSRLSCQIAIVSELDGLVLRLPDRQRQRRTDLAPAVGTPPPTGGATLNYFESTRDRRRGFIADTLGDLCEGRACCAKLFGRTSAARARLSAVHVDRVLQSLRAESVLDIQKRTWCYRTPRSWWRCGHLFCERQPQAIAIRTNGRRLNNCSRTIVKTQQLWILRRLSMTGGRTLRQAKSRSVTLGSNNPK